MSGQSPQSTVVERLARHLYRPVGLEDRARARLHLLDWLGCAAIGRSTDTGRLFAGRRPQEGDAFVWGAFGNILEMDDVDKRALLHPGPTVIPAALAASLSAGNTDHDALLRAIVLGYEAVIRLGRAVGPSHYALWHNTGSCGSIGAAAAAASILSLTESETAHALALAVSQAAGVWQTRHPPANIGKQLHTAHAARAGVSAARLAKAGGHGPAEILEGPQGFFAATCTGADANDVMAAHGRDWLIHDVSFKPWAACRHAHAAIDAALVLRDEGVSVGNIQCIFVRTYRDALTFCDKPVPTTEIEAKFSLQHSVAVVLDRGAPTLADFREASLMDTQIAGLREKVSVHCDPDLDAAYPARFGAEVELSLLNGQAHCVRMSDALGDPENPMSERQILQKAETLLAEAGLSAATAEALVTAVRRNPADLPFMLEDVLA